MEPQIVMTPEVIGGKPRIDGTRIGVHIVGPLVREHGHSVEEVCEKYPRHREATPERLLVHAPSVVCRVCF
jgi:uncharacterized protein (DUF433 family)